MEDVANKFRPSRNSFDIGDMVEYFDAQNRVWKGPVKIVGRTSKSQYVLKTTKFIERSYEQLRPFVSL